MESGLAAEAVSSPGAFEAGENLDSAPRMSRTIFGFTIGGLLLALTITSINWFWLQGIIRTADGEIRQHRSWEKVYEKERQDLIDEYLEYGFHDPIT